MCSKISEEYESSACPPDSGVIRCKPVSPGGTSDPVVYTADIPNTVCEETEGDGDCDAPYYVIINGNTIKRVSEAELQMLEKQCVPRAGAEADIEKLKRSFQNEDANSGLDNSLSEENLLAHISRQVGFQQQLLCSAIDGTLHDRPLGLTPTIATGNIQSTPVNSTAQMPGTILHSQNGTSLVTSTPVTGQRALQSLPMNGQDHCLFTPHPKTGQLLYLAPSDGSSPQLFQQLTPTANTPNTSDFVTPNIREHSKKPAMLKLNSSGEDEDNSHNCSSDSPPTPLDSSSDRDSMQFELSLFNNTGEESREQHNMKERRRRLRIKDACDVMRKLVPGMSDKTDKATVFEFGARYIHFLKGFVGNKHDKDFLIKYSPY
ncbi:uncharacterized protein LOC110466009 isoform X2 [Mizuhopecten yessoensis]|uniref:uncharacterized protein LOC110466009 isoform X2 n=1 Tax=Mizuhopecten yessoensis TaxID=6573 RepID=UPI000B45A6CA|nr:uncharacterized protein LOC110466009 isoform X2 [Mizuhopecten yessoensis]